MYPHIVATRRTCDKIKPLNSSRDTAVVTHDPARPTRSLNSHRNRFPESAPPPFPRIHKTVLREKENVARLYFYFFFLFSTGRFSPTNTYDAHCATEERHIALFPKLAREHHARGAVSPPPGFSRQKFKSIAVVCAAMASLA